MTKNQRIFYGIDRIVQEREVDREFVIEGLSEAIALSCKKTFNIERVEVVINYETKRITIHGIKTVVDEVIDPTLEISLEEARTYRKTVKIGDELNIKLKVEKDMLERATAQSVKQTFSQKLKDAEYKRIIEDYGSQIGKLVLGYVEEIKEPNIYFTLGKKTLAILGPKGQIPNELIEPDVEIPLIIESIRPQSKKGPKIIVSRTNPNLVNYLMEKYVPEIASGDIEIVNTVRDAGDRTKLAIRAKDEDADIDIMGSCIGTKGSRINKVKKALNGENIDLIEMFDDVQLFISSALAPSLVTAVQIINEETRESRVIVPDDQYSLAIGHNGQNARLASKLTGWKIDIKSETIAKAEGIDYEDDII
ncbi:MAG: transcription termination factor NusA [Mycoplasmatales bacterium]